MLHKLQQRLLILLILVRNDSLAANMTSFDRLIASDRREVLSMVRAEGTTGKLASISDAAGRRQLLFARSSQDGHYLSLVERLVRCMR